MVIAEQANHWGWCKQLHWEQSGRGAPFHQAGAAGGCRGPVQPTGRGLGGCHAMGASGRTVRGTGLGSGCRGWSGPAFSGTLPSGFAKGMWQQGCAGREALISVLPSPGGCGSGWFWLLSKFAFCFK